MCNAFSVFRLRRFSSYRLLHIPLKLSGILFTSVLQLEIVFSMAISQIFWILNTYYNTINSLLNEVLKISLVHKIGLSFMRLCYELILIFVKFLPTNFFEGPTCLVKNICGLILVKVNHQVYEIAHISAFHTSENRMHFS